MIMIWSRVRVKEMELILGVFKCVSLQAFTICALISDAAAAQDNEHFARRRDRKTNQCQSNPPTRASSQHLMVFIVCCNGRAKYVDKKCRKNNNNNNNQIYIHKHRLQNKSRYSSNTAAKFSVCYCSFGSQFWTLAIYEIYNFIFEIIRYLNCIPLSLVQMSFGNTKKKRINKKSSRVLKMFTFLYNILLKQHTHMYMCECDCFYYFLI